MACGNPPHVRPAGELGIGAIAFNFEPIYDLRGRIEAYKEAIAELHRAARAVQERQRDDHQLGHLLRDPRRAREIALRRGRGYLVTMVNLYHDTMPKSPDAITWPDTPIALRDIIGPTSTPTSSSTAHRRRHMLCGTPDEVCEQIARWGDVGMDQLVFGLPSRAMYHEEILARSSSSATR